MFKGEKNPVITLFQILPFINNIVVSIAKILLNHEEAYSMSISIHSFIRWNHRVLALRQAWREGGYSCLYLQNSQTDEVRDLRTEFVAQCDLVWWWHTQGVAGAQRKDPGPSWLGGYGTKAGDNGMEPWRVSATCQVEKWWKVFQTQDTACF